jgi:hypothetical protein
MLPSDAGPTKFSALQAIIYSLLLIPAIDPIFYRDEWICGLWILGANIFMSSAGCSITSGNDDSLKKSNIQRLYSSACSIVEFTGR